VPQPQLQPRAPQKQAAQPLAPPALDPLAEAEAALVRDLARIDAAIRARR
jgi:hypothetical protein